MDVAGAYLLKTKNLTIFEKEPIIDVWQRPK